MTSDETTVWALRGVRPSTKKLFKQASAMKGVNIGELADSALREAAERVLTETLGEEVAQKMVSTLSENRRAAGPTGLN
ncbi:hypothetical protein [Ruegeria sp.]|uniref:hypothetical protein n=1 Tax=Ruegeria sp. TaxID=1879320 RepID=UPI003C7CBC2A